MLLRTILVLVATTSALFVGPPRIGCHSKRSAAAKSHQALALVPLVTSLPASAVGDASDLDGLNTGLTVVLVLLGGFIAKNVLDLGTEVGTQSAERIDAYRKTNAASKGKPRRNVVVYDDTDYTYKSNSKAVQNSRDRKKVSKQVGAGGKRFAPWMIIDEEKVEKIKAQRNAAKKAPKKAAGFRNPFSKA